METRQIGSLTVTVVGLGCNNFGMRIGQEEASAVVSAAVDAGITLFDTADIYGRGQSEEMLGAALGSRRDDVLIATKFGGPMDEGKAGAQPDYVRAACDASLQRLGTDRIDLYQLHFPDRETPIEDTLGALDELVSEGKVREIGCSNFSADQIHAATAISSERDQARFVSAQNHLSLLHRDEEAELIPACERNGLGILPYFPLASGLLTGKYTQGEEPPAGTRLAVMPPERRERFLNDETERTVARLEAFASERGHTLLELAMSWLAGLPAMASVIAGATKPDQVRANVAAAQAWTLTTDDRAEIDAIAKA